MEIMEIWSPIFGHFWLFLNNLFYNAILATYLIKIITF